MRHASTPAEEKLWELLRGGRLGVRFRRQHAIGQFIVDLYCAASGLVVEMEAQFTTGELRTTRSVRGTWRVRD